MNGVLPQQKRAFENYWGHAKSILVFKDGAIVQSYANHGAHIIDQHLKKEKSRQITSRACKKMLLKEEILLHYQNSWSFFTFDISNIIARARAHPRANAFRSVINRTCKSNFWLHVFSAQLPVFDLDMCLFSCYVLHFESESYWFYIEIKKVFFSIQFTSI